MSPTPQDQQQLPSSQDLPVLTDPIDPSSIMPADLVEVEQASHPQENIPSVESPTLTVPVEPDYENKKVTRPDRADPKNSGVSPFRKAAAGLMGVVVLATGGVSADHLLGESTPASASDKNTEQLIAEDLETAPSTIALESTDQTVPSGLDGDVGADNASTEQNDPSTPSNNQSELLLNQNENAEKPVFQTNNSGDGGTAGTNNEDSAASPINIEQDVVGAEDYPGEITVIRSVDFAGFLMNNQQKTGLSPTIEVSNAESGILTFSDPNGYVFIISGRMKDGNIIVDDKMPMNGIGAITIIDAKGNQITVKSSKDPNVKPATNVAKKGQDSVTTDQVIFPGSTLEARHASEEGAQITAEVDKYIKITYQQ